ncbi:hypothetical protein Bbelb_324030 [Branchiostoma belcheri]|nr:hypothetical protein Bbelb_324030 [Branchiostoma belcheri]
MAVAVHSQTQYQQTTSQPWPNLPSTPKCCKHFETFGCRSRTVANLTERTPDNHAPDLLLTMVGGRGRTNDAAQLYAEPGSIAAGYSRDMTDDLFEENGIQTAIEASNKWWEKKSAQKRGKKDSWGIGSCEERQRELCCPVRETHDVHSGGQAGGALPTVRKVIRKIAPHTKSCDSPIVVKNALSLRDDITVPRWVLLPHRTAYTSQEVALVCEVGLKTATRD